ncbi:unnamed protein product [Blepharisma stoltei]|uniref:O-methyltransferase n=1 Tax=Blepharisma stoltei TaxID=1481888 RepID=A0AAU9IIL4_9CILI|nr:unnamed protein product [Blepharisma stoltei]
MAQNDLDCKLNMLLIGPQIGMLLFSALEHNIPALLAEGPKTASQLSELTSTVSDKLERALLQLVSVGLFSYNPNTNIFSNSPLSERFLEKNLANLYKFSLSPWKFETLTCIPGCLSSNFTAPELKFHQSMDESMSLIPGTLEIYHEGMAGVTNLNSREVALAIDLRSSHKIIDIGGGDGTLLIELSKIYPNLEFTLFEQPQIRDIALKKINQAGKQINFIAGSCFESIPSGFDTYIIKHVLYSYPDDKVMEFLGKCRQSLNVGNRLVIIELMLEIGQSTLLERYLDVHLMILNNGKIRSRGQLESLLKANHFRVLNFSSAGSDYVLESVAI